MDATWQFWVDRGGTFTDIVARHPDGQTSIHKYLSHNPEQYDDATVHAIGQIAGPKGKVGSVKMGTTVATNALLERKGARVAFVTNQGLADVLRIGYQNRPDIFARHIILPEQLASRKVEVVGRLDAEGREIVALDLDHAESALKALRDENIDAIAIALMHAYRNPSHELALGELARTLGFSQISLSHQASPLIKIVGRGDTAVVDAYLSPILRHYVEQVARPLGDARLMFMQSNGGLVDADKFRGKDAVLSGPAGGIVGAVEVCRQAGFEELLTFDMGGTSTDVAHYAGELERRFDTEIAGVRLRAPMLHIHTVAAGGGSIIFYENGKFRVGPESAGAVPGPACYRRDGPATVTDAQLVVGKINADTFPRVFGPNADAPLDAEASLARFSDFADAIAAETGLRPDPRDLAHGCLSIAIDNMANAIKEISIRRGIDVSDYILCGFGGAAGQVSCRVADALAVKRVMIHPFASVLSAYGMGLAQTRDIRQRSLEISLSEADGDLLRTTLDTLQSEARASLTAQLIPEDRQTFLHRVWLRYAGTDSALPVESANADVMRAAFEAEHLARYGFTVADRDIIMEQAEVEAIGHMDVDVEPVLEMHSRKASEIPKEPTQFFTCAVPHQSAEPVDAAIYRRAQLQPGDIIPSPAMIVAETTTVIVEPGWQAEVTSRDHLVLERIVPLPKRSAIGTDVDPIMLEVFNNLFMSTAEQMGVTLQNTAWSVNVKERLDFSCAVFDPEGGLVANAPHIPVHLGSMGESVRSILKSRATTMKPGDVYMLNNPYNGGTHLPDVTVIMPVFDDAGELLFLTASRGHQADIGGKTPGSMPPDSVTLEQEGVLIDDLKVVSGGRLDETTLRNILSGGRYPARNPDANMADLRAQIASCQTGANGLLDMADRFGVEVVRAYMRHVQDNAAEQVRNVLDRLDDGEFVYPYDFGAEIRVSIRIDRQQRTAEVDFTGTSAQQADNNFNAPSAVCKAAVLYVFRTLVDAPIPMNEGCLRPITIRIPEGSMLNPRYPAAVVAGNVETSQCITDCIYGALKALAASQGTMNNFTFGNDRHQYYETICGGTGAGPNHDGTAAVHSHMTNSRLTDPEILELRYPVRLESHEIRHGSGGRGRFTGGDGTIRKIRFLEDMEAAILSNHRIVAPFGLEGGEDGQAGDQWVERADGTVTPLRGRDKCHMAPGDLFVIQTPTGGGYGPVDQTEE